MPPFLLTLVGAPTPREETDMVRIPILSRDDMSDAQRRVHDRVVAGPRGKVQGPLLAALHSPELADRWQALGAFLRYETSLPPRISELAILVTARRWQSEVEWSIHAPIARAAGLDGALIDTVRAGLPPVACSDELRDAHDFVVELLGTTRVSDSLYARIAGRWGVKGTVEFTALVGYYTMVALTLNAHELPVPDGVVGDLGTVA